MPFDGILSFFGIVRDDAMAYVPISSIKITAKMGMSDLLSLFIAVVSFRFQKRYDPV